MRDVETHFTDVGEDRLDTTAAIAADLAFKAADLDLVSVDEVHGLYYATDGKGEIHTFDLAKLLDDPRSAAGDYKVATLASFKEFVDRHRDDGLTIWAHPTSGKVDAVLNDHANQDDPRWGDFRVSLQLLHTDEWKRWAGRDNKLESQQSLAEHIEESIPDIVEPDAATLLEVAQSFQATTDVNFSSRVDLTGGSIGLQYDEEQSATAGRRGELEIPQKFLLSLAPFEGEDKVPVTARLRWRVNQGDLRIGYKIDRPTDILRGSIDRIVGELHATYEGSVFIAEAPPAARR